MFINFSILKVEIGKYIVIDTEICHGQPTFKGTRIMVHLVLDMLAAGYSFKEIVKSYPSLNEEMIKEALQLGAKVLEKKYVEIPGR